jgi:alpha-1,2-mannosyltransferase
VPRVRRTVWLWLCAVVLLAAPFVKRADRQAREDTGDWSVYFRAGQAMAARQPIYTLEHGEYKAFKNAPLVALCCAPLSLLPVRVARQLWLLAEAALLLLLVVFGLRLVRAPPPARVLDLWLPLAAFAVVARFWVNQAESGQTTTLWLCLCAGSILALRAQRLALAGTLLALAVCWKLVPICIAPYLLLQRGGRPAVGWFALALAVFLLLPGLWVGLGPNLELLAGWHEQLDRTEVEYQVWRAPNQSLHALMVRAMYPTDPNPYGVPHLLQLSLPQIRLLWLGTALVVAALLYGFVGRDLRRSNSAGEPPRDALHLALLFVYLTVMNPLAWRYNFLALLLPVLLVLERMRRARRPVVTGVLLAVAALLLNLDWSGHAGEQFLAHGGRLWGALMLGLAACQAEWAARADRTLRAGAAAR